MFWLLVEYVCAAQFFQGFHFSNLMCFRTKSLQSPQKAPIILKLESTGLPVIQLYFDTIFLDMILNRKDLQMAYPYKKMDSADFDYIRSVTAPQRVKIGEEISEDYYHDEMPNYGSYPPELYVEVISEKEISLIMKYCNEHNIPVVVRGAGTGLAGGSNCKYGGIMMSVMRMNKIFPIDHQNQTVTCEPGALLIDVQNAAKQEGLFYPPDPGEKNASIGGNVITNAGGMKAVRYGLTRDFVRCVRVVLPDGSIEQFSSNVVKNTTGYSFKDLVIGSEGTLCVVTQVTLKLLPEPKYTCTLVIPFGSLEECADMVPHVLALPYIPTAIAEYVKAAKRIALSHGIRVEPCGHCGDGNIHTEMLRGPEMSDEEWEQATTSCLKELYALSKRLGGQLSGEHGIGNGRLEYFKEFVGPRMIELHKAVKLAFDPNLILNPGKVVEFE